MDYTVLRVTKFPPVVASNWPYTWSLVKMKAMMLDALLGLDQLPLISFSIEAQLSLINIFEVKKMKGIARVHERFIMRRWRMDVFRRHLSIAHFGSYPQMKNEYKEFKEIECALHELVDNHIKLNDFTSMPHVVLRESMMTSIMTSL
ncbi:hypothetical protein Syun_011920 [Stephania yunnanensis]|uniref:Uncharacterized protein n=1 Tax=Stephania yunnanensis TaxID=152371 RepID=A0AAP0JZG9_9MAGN